MLWLRLGRAVPPRLCVKNQPTQKRKTPRRGGCRGSAHAGSFLGPPGFAALRLLCLFAAIPSSGLAPLKPPTARWPSRGHFAPHLSLRPLAFGISPKFFSL